MEKLDKIYLIPTEEATELRDAREQIARLRSTLASVIGDRAGRVQQAMNEAYQMAARAMCAGCAMGVPVEMFDYGDGSYVWVHDEGEECEASPIHDLIEKLNEVNDERK